MKRLLKRLFGPRFRQYARRWRAFLLDPILTRPPVIPDAASQLHLQLFYRHLRDSGAKLPSLRDAGFKVYSQADEDGLLLYIFSLIGTVNRKCVEISAGSGSECNTANLIINHHWSGLLFDGDPELVEAGRRYFNRHPATYVYPPKFVQAWVTRDNINALIRENGFEGPIDLLSLDIDGIDYWLWESLEAIAPRVVVVEYQDVLGPDRACTVPYRDDFRAADYLAPDGKRAFFGASLPAFVKLGRRKGYRLVGSNVYGYNAFFIQEGLGQQWFPEVAAADCLKHPKVIEGVRDRLPAMENFPWVDV